MAWYDIYPNAHKPHGHRTFPVAIPLEAADDIIPDLECRYQQAGAEGFYKLGNRVIETGKLAAITRMGHDYDRPFDEGMRHLEKIAKQNVSIPTSGHSLSDAVKSEYGFLRDVAACYRKIEEAAKAIFRAR